MPRKHLVIPDTQCKPGVPLQHLGWVGEYWVEKKPEVVVMIGDFADMPSLSSYDKGKLTFEGRRYKADIESVHEAMSILMAPIEKHNAARRKKKLKPYKPRKVLNLGNHEHRVTRVIQEDPKLDGTIGLEDLQYEKFGWEVHPFLDVVIIDGIAYSHYFESGSKGQPVASARALVTKKHMSCTMGHNQKTDLDMSQRRADGKQIIGLFAGCCYLHDEDYLGPQGNAVRRQIVMKHEVDDGQYDPMLVSLNYLKRVYG